MTVQEDTLLLAAVEDKINQCESSYMLTHSQFLDPRQKMLVEAMCHRYQGLRYAFYGGYEEAERSIICFCPDYIEVKTAAELQQYFQDNPTVEPLALLRATPRGPSLTHRDYLGSLLGLGVKREWIGDILVGPTSADIIISRNLLDFLLTQYDKAGRVALEVQQLPLCQLQIPEKQRQQKRDTVASLRLDNVLAAAFDISRSQAQESIAKGIVFIDSVACLKADRVVATGEKLTLRGKGKAILLTVGTATKKGRLPIVLEKYM